MEEGCHAECHFSGCLRLWCPVARLYSIGQQVAMRQHGAFGKSRGSTRVLQNSQVITGSLDRQIENLDAFLRVGLQHVAHGMQHWIFVTLLVGQAWLSMPGIELAEGIERLEHRWQVISWSRKNDVFQCCIRSYRADDRVKIVQHDNGTRTRISQLMLHLALSV